MADGAGCFGETLKKDQNTTKKYQLRYSKILLGDMRHIDISTRRLYELALPENLSKCVNFFAPFEATSEQLEKLRFERQTFSQWKVQREFQKLHYRHRKRAKRKIIYILPIGTFPSFVLEKIPGLRTSLFELLCCFVSVFYLGFSVEMLKVVDLKEISCQTRVHPGTGKLQILVGDVLLYLKKCLPNDGFCIVGISWEDLYPGNEWNFVLGEASCENGCAAISFGHHEPKSSEKIYTLDTQINKNEYDRGRFKGVERSNKIFNCSYLEIDSQMNNEKLNKSWDRIEERKSEDQCVQDLSGFNQQEYIQNAKFIEEIKCSNGLANELEIITSNEGILTPCTKDSSENFSCEEEMHNGINGSSCMENDDHKSCSGFENCLLGRIKRIDAYEIWKFFRVVSHELGHVFGITHCSYFSCAMNESTSVSEAVNQPLFMCPVCLRKIQKAAGFSVVDRYTKLQHFLETLYSDLVQVGGSEGKLDKHNTFPGNQSRDNGSFITEDLQRFAKATQWIDSVLSFLENE